MRNCRCLLRGGKCHIVQIQLAVLTVVTLVTVVIVVTVVTLTPESLVTCGMCSIKIQTENSCKNTNAPPALPIGNRPICDRSATPQPFGPQGGCITKSTSIVLRQMALSKYSCSDSYYKLSD